MAKFKSLNIGDTVRVVSLADTDDRCGVTPTMRESIGGVFKITGLGRQYGTDLGRVQLSDVWWYSPKGLEVVEVVEPTVTEEPTGDEHGTFVTTETPVGTRVRYISKVKRDFEVGTEFILVRHDGDDYPRVDYTDNHDYEYISYSHLRVVTTAQSGGSIQNTPTAPTEPAPEPVVHTTEDLKYTRVRVKGIGAEGVVVGRSKRGNVAVLHDETSDSYHAGNYCAKDFVGVANRIQYYQASALDIIGGVQ